LSGAPLYSSDLSAHDSFLSLAMNIAHTVEKRAAEHPQALLRRVEGPRSIAIKDSSMSSLDSQPNIYYIVTEASHCSEILILVKNDGFGDLLHRHLIVLLPFNIARLAS
jgi:hypothetical protein